MALGAPSGRSRRDVLAIQTWQRVLALDPTGPGRATGTAVRESFNAKLSALREAEAALHAVVETRSGTWGLVAMVQLGHVYENMSSTLDNSTYLTPEQHQLYVEHEPMVETVVAARFLSPSHSERGPIVEP